MRSLVGMRWLLLALALAVADGCATDVPDDDSSEPPGDDDTSQPGDDESSATPVGGDDDASIPVTPTPTAAPTPTEPPTPTPTPTPRPGDSDGDGVLDADDCAPFDPLSWPGAGEICDSVDNDCDGDVDESLYYGDTGNGVCGVHLMFPGEGAMGVPTALNVSIDFDSTAFAEPDWIDAHVVDSTGAVTQLGMPTVDEDIPTLVHFEPMTTRAGETYTMVVTVAQHGTFVPPYAGWVIKASARFAHDPPCGVNFNTSNEMKITRLGDTSPLVLNGINANIASSQTQLALVFLGTTPALGFPAGELEVMLGAMYRVGIDTYTVDTAYGFPTLLSGAEIDAEGAFTTEKQDIALLVPIGDDLGFMYTRDARMTGTAETSGDFRYLTSFTTTGYVTQADMHKLLVSAGQQSLESQIKFDQDLNQDGVPDAATLEMTSAPAFATLVECQ